MAVYCLSKIIQGRHTVYLQTGNNNNKKNYFITVFETTIVMYPSMCNGI